MSAGYGFGGVCYADPADMELAWTQTVGPRISHENGETWVYTGRMADPEDFTSGMLIRSKFGCDPGSDCGYTETVAQVNVFSYQCEIFTPGDAMEASWLVAAVWAAIYGVRLLKRALP